MRNSWFAVRQSPRKFQCAAAEGGMRRAVDARMPEARVSGHAQHRSATSEHADRDDAQSARSRVHHHHLSRARQVGQSARPSGLFRRFAQGASSAMGRPWAFVGAAGIIVVWATLGPLFKYSDTWQLVINTGTTIITFLMVFLIQNTQNRDTAALRLKLDELILATLDARNQFVDIEDLDDKALDALEKEMHHNAKSPSSG
jgi:low affinity Fe/Cu permease